MSNKLHAAVTGAILILWLFAAAGASAQGEAPAARKGNVPLEQVMEAIAKRTGKTVIVDPRVQGEALVLGADVAKLDYAELLSVLQVHGFAVVARGNVIRVIPDATIRQQPVPYANGKQSHLDAEYVTRTFTLKHVPASHLVPILRPLLPQYAHLVAFPCTNMLMMVDTYANVQRIEQLLRELDVGGPYTPPSCSGEMK